MTVFLVISVLLYAAMTWVGLRAFPEMAGEGPKAFLSHAVVTVTFLGLYLWGSWLLVLHFCH